MQITTHSTTERDIFCNISVSGVVLLCIGGILGTSGVYYLGKNLTPFPKPKEKGYLVTRGAYKIVRHPIYAGLIFGTLGWSLIVGSVLGVVMTVVLFIFFDLKSRREEKWLSEKYKDYPVYKSRVKKLIPWVY